MIIDQVLGEGDSAWNVGVRGDWVHPLGTYVLVDAACWKIMFVRG